MPMESADGSPKEANRDESEAAATSTTAADAADGADSSARGSEAPTALERLLGWVGGAAARGVLASSRAPRLAEEPLPYGADVDWERALEMTMRRRDSERQRLDRIESKIAPIIAGTVAGLGLFIDKSASTLDCLSGSLLLVPLAMLFLAFRTFEYIDTPNLDELVRTYERWPLTYVRSVVVGTADAVSKNGPVIDRKARELNRAMAVLLIVVVLVIGVRTYEAGTQGLRDHRAPAQERASERKTFAHAHRAG
jgi:hypothetical protein